jgi:esterase/lipase
MTVSFKKVVLPIITSIILIALMIGNLLDWEAERVVNQLYSKDQKGVILGADTIEYKNHHQKALILIHGFLDTPKIFHQIAQLPQLQKKFDIFAPRLPFHGVDLKTAAKLNNDVVANHLANYINQTAKHYKEVTVVGHSYGGALIVEMIKNHLIHDHLNIVLYAPAIYIRSNNRMTNMQLNAYGLWRNYCNYSQIGCSYHLKNYDDKAKFYYQNYDISLRYKIIPAVKTLFKLDNMNRSYLQRMSYPFSLIAIKNDYRINYQELKKACQKNTACTFYSLLNGSHAPHISNNADQFNKILLSIARSPNNKSFVSQRSELSA